MGIFESAWRTRCSGASMPMRYERDRADHAEPPVVQAIAAYTENSAASRRRTPPTAG